MPESPKCPTCGFVMCEQFDDVPSETDPTVTYAVPNGGFICYHCGIEGRPRSEGRMTLKRSDGSWDEELKYYSGMPAPCGQHEHKEASDNESTCPSCKAFMDHVRRHA